MLQVWWACFLSMPASAGSYEFCILSLSCFLFERCAWFEGGSRVSDRQPTPFLLPRQKKWGKEKASLAGGLSGETHCAPASLRSDSHRKFEFLYGSTPVLQLACGVAQALRLELPLPLAGEGGGEGACVSFPCWGKEGMGAFASCWCGVLGLREGVGSRPDSRPHFFCVAKRNGGKKRRACRRLVRRNSLRSCVAPFRQPPEI